VSACRLFPVLLNGKDAERRPDCPRAVPWEWLAPHEQQAWLNHGQSLETLASRGGLDPLEMAYVLNDKRWQTPASRADYEHMWDSAVADLVARTRGSR
jgi:hypothetical protein